MGPFAVWSALGSLTAPETSQSSNLVVSFGLLLSILESSQATLVVKEPANAGEVRETQIRSLGGKIAWRMVY